MKVAVYCDNIATFTRMNPTLETSGDRYYYVVCNNQNQHFLRFAVTNTVWALKQLSVALLKAALQGRILLTSKRLSDDCVTRRLQRLKPDIALHASSAIYRRPTLAASGRGILNAHIGKLPGYRGRSVAEWSLVEGAATGITVFFIDEGIDTGSPIVLFNQVPVPSDCRSVSTWKEMLFSLDSAMYVQAIARIKQGEMGKANEVRQGKRYYVMSKLLTEVLDTAIAGGLVGVVNPEPATSQGTHSPDSGEHYCAKEIH